MKGRNRQRDLTQLMTGVMFLITIALPAIAMQMKQEPVLEKMPKQQWAEMVLDKHYRVKDYEILAEVATTASDTENVPIELIIAIMKVESTFDHRKISVCHAIGFMQVRPDVWDGETPYNIHDKYENIMAGAYVLNDYSKQLGGFDKAIPAYNVGITKYKAGKARAAQARYRTKVSHELRAISAAYPMTLSTD